jgi:hypothetical protein
MGGSGVQVRVGGVAALLVLAACGSKPPLVAAPKSPQPDPNAEVIRYCAGTVTEWDEHRCIWELTPEQQRHRAFSQRLTIRGGKLVRFETVTGSGANFEDGEISEYTYDGRSIAFWRKLNRNGVEKGSVTVNEDGDWVRWLDAKGRPRVTPDTTVSGLRRSFDARGRVLGYVYVDALGNPARYSGEVFEKRVKLNQAGAVVEESFFGQKGEAVLGPSGAHQVAHQVDARGLEVERRYFDVQGQPMLVSGVGIVRSRYDAFGNAIESAFFTLDGSSVMAQDEGAAIVRKTRDEHGNEIERRCLDALGKPVVGAPRGGARKLRYDEHDALIELAYTDADGKPARPAALDYAIKRQERDQRGNLIAESYFGADAAPLLLADGYHGVRISYDARDNAVSYGYVDVTGAPVMLTQGYQARRLSYDGDRLIRTDFFDLSGKVTSTQEVGYAADGSESTPKTCQGKLQQELVAAISARAGLARSCYERLLATAPNAQGRLLIGMRIEADGQVTRVSTLENTVGDEGLSACVKSKLMRNYPRGPEGGCAEVNVPIRFEPKKNDPPTP